ncbi:MAG TPA: type II secretion system protein [Bacilli bacterium]|nr:type II secretion system protein [Bacilli bacterium]
MKKNKGFTLIELIAIIVLLGLLALIVVPKVKDIIETSREKALEEQIGRIEEEAKKYALEIINDIPENELGFYISLDDLKDNGYLEDKDIIDPTNKEKMTGCVVVKYIESDDKYTYNYQTDCSE